MSGATSLLNSMNRIEAPFIKVTIGQYTFGVYSKSEAGIQDVDGFYRQAKISYPNYVKSLNVSKINGQVNNYRLTLQYPVRVGDDPNFFEKVFSSVSRSRKIIFSYGDAMMPQHIYKDEEALITGVTTSFSVSSSVITYNVTAVSSAALGQVITKQFPAYSLAKPSDIILKTLYNPDFGLLDLFYGMVDKSAVQLLGLVEGNDKAVPIAAKRTTPLEYIKYLVSCMKADGAVSGQATSGSIYVMTIHDEILGETSNNNVTRQLGGPYFKVSKVNTAMEHSEAYEIDIGYPSHNIITNFQVQDGENYAIFYDWQQKINPREYVNRINDNGEMEEIYSPAFSSANETFTATSADTTWWTKVTQYPISATITLKGLLRPATLMTYVRLNVYMWGAKHISSGLYIVTSQTDDINESGYRTTLTLTRIKGIEL